MITKMNVRLASMVLNAMKIRETSYDKEAANVATAKADAEKAAEPENIYAGMVDYSKFYRKTMEQSAEEAANEADEPAMANVLYLLMVTAWNDIASWAKENAS